MKRYAIVFAASDNHHNSVNLRVIVTPERLGPKITSLQNRGRVIVSVSTTDAPLTL